MVTYTYTYTYTLGLTLTRELFNLTFAICHLPFDLTRYRYLSHQAGFCALTRANHRHIGIRNPSTTAQHR